MDPQLKEILAILDEEGAVLARQRKHQVYRLPDGRMFALATTPSDRHAYANALRALKRQLGLDGERGGEGTRRAKKKRAATSTPSRASLPGGMVTVNDFREQLASVARLIPPAPAAARTNTGGKKIVHPIHGSRQRRGGSAQSVDLSALITRFSPKTR